MSTPTLVSCEWLKDNLGNPDVIVLDATLSKPKSAGEIPYQDQKIPESRFFDIDGAFSDPSIDLPHMMCDRSQFEKEAQRLGIHDSSKVVVYDNHGVYSSPRAWWMLKSMGLKQVSVLNGGLPEWIDKGFSTENRNEPFEGQGSFLPAYDTSCFVDSTYILSKIENPDVVILDARSEGRFKAIEPEPRAGLRGGHIPNSISLPFTHVIDGYRMKDQEQLAETFERFDLKDKKLVFTCGSGLTACIILLAAHVAGLSNLAVYDGSWSEWGQPSDLPVITG